MNPYRILSIIFILLLSHGATAYWQHTTGKTSERVKWQGKQIEELAQANQMIADLNNRFRAQEQKWNNELNVLTTQYLKEKQNAQRKTDALIADARAGFLVLWDAHAMQAGVCGSGETTTTPTGSDDREGSQLSGEFTGFLISEAGRADQIVHQLTACQGVILADRKR